MKVLVKILGFLLIFGLFAGCKKSDKVPKVVEVDVIGNVRLKAFDRNQGVFDIIIAPKDIDGNLIADGVKPDNFKLENIRVERVSDNTQVGNATGSITIEIIQTGQSTPLDIVIDFDTSGSMSWNDPNRLAIDAGKSVVDLMRTIDMGAIVEFGGNSAVVVQEFTSDKTLLKSKIDGLVYSGSTPLYDSIHKSLELIEDKNSSNAAIVVLADGDNNRPPYDRNAIITRANQRNVPIFCIALGQGLDFSDLIFFADNTGGAFAEATDAQALQALFDSIGFGIFQGRIVITVNIFFNPTLPNAGQYRMVGQLITDLGGGRVVTPFTFTFTVS